MKPALATITLLFFLFTFSIKSSPAREVKPEPVVDTSGEKLKARVSYYVLPASKGEGGGLSSADIGTGICPRVIVQESFELSKGEPVQFLPLNSDVIISTSTNLNIKSISEKISLCENSGIWRLTGSLKETLLVDTNGAERYIFSWFMIEKEESKGIYILKFCPNPRFVSECGDLGITHVGSGTNRERYLGLAKSGIRVVFKKANNENNAVMSS